MSEALPGRCCTRVPQAIIFGVVLCGSGKQFRKPQTSVCCECSFGLRWQLKQPPHMCCHSNVLQTIQWQLILSGSCHLWSGSSSRQNLSSWNEGCHLQRLYCLLLSRKSVTPVKIQGEEVDMVPFYKYLGVHILNSLDRTNKTYCTRRYCSL